MLCFALADACGRCGKQRREAVFLSAVELLNAITPKENCGYSRICTSLAVSISVRANH